MYLAGWSKQEIAIEPRGYAMFGYGQWSHRARGKQTALYARAVYVQDVSDHALMFCCLDLGCITGAMRSGVVEALQRELGSVFWEPGLVLTATHTHSGPGGCSHEALYNMPTPGFVPEHLEAVVAAAVAALLEAKATAEPTELGYAEGMFADTVPVAWNRSLPAYNRNPDVRPRGEHQTHLALNRAMRLLSFRRQGRLHSLLSLFGVHATCIGNTLHKHDGDNKGYAAADAEQLLRGAGASDAVAIFAQATAGDVSPHYHGPQDRARRRAISGAAEYVYAENNGRLQSTQALATLSEHREAEVAGEIDAILSYVDFAGVHVEPRFANGETEAWTSEPCHGVAFFRGTPIDGSGLPGPLAAIAERAARALRAYRLSAWVPLPAAQKNHYRQLYAAQGAKAVLLEAGSKRVLGQDLERFQLPSVVDPLIGELKRQAKVGALKTSPLVPTVLPLQIVVLGQLALLCCPGEFTTTAGQRLMATVQATLRERGVEQVLICTYCNDYMGYVTTQEEYAVQCYEGGHTLFGQWTLAAFQTGFSRLAAELLKPDAERGHDRETRPEPVNAAELALRSGLPVPV